MPKKQFFVSEVKLGRFNGHKLVEKSLGKGLTLRHEFCHELANHFFTTWLWLTFCHCEIVPGMTPRRDDPSQQFVT